VAVSINLLAATTFFKRLRGGIW